MEQVKHASKPVRCAREQLFGIRPLAEELVINPTRWRRYASSSTKASSNWPGRRRLRLRQRARKTTDNLRAGQTIVATAMERLRRAGLSDDEIRRLFEPRAAGLAAPARTPKPGGHVTDRL